MYDITIEKGTIVNGMGNPWLKADIGISNGKISQIKPELKEGDEKINAKGLIVSPGVIDVHSHSDLSILKHNKGKSRLMQGITTDATGNCGISPHTFAKEYGQVLEDQLHNSEGINEKDHVDWRTLGEWREKVDKRGIGLNIAPFCGFGTVRASVMGKEGEGGERSKPTDEELEKMKKLVEEAMNDGAFGMSTGLEYATQRNAFKEEIVELLRVVRRYGGSYMSHIRSEDDFLIEAVKEFIMICDQAGVRGTISHHKAASPWNWGKPVETLRLIEEAREQGINIICDAYPWTRVAVRDVGSFFLNEGESIREKKEELLKQLENDDAWKKLKKQARKQFEKEKNFIKQKQEEGEETGHKETCRRIPWNPVSYYTITRSKSHPETVGKNFEQAAQILGMEDPWEAVRRIYLADEGDTSVSLGRMREADYKQILLKPFSAISTDGRALDKPLALHPRNYGTYPKVLGKYVRDEEELPLEDAIRKMTSLPAQFLGLSNRGVIREGAWADIVIFDPQKIRNMASYESPCEDPEGIKYVIVNGTLSIKNGEYTGELAGKVLQNPNRDN